MIHWFRLFGGSLVQVVRWIRLFAGSGGSLDQVRWFTGSGSSLVRYSSGGSLDQLIHFR